MAIGLRNPQSAPRVRPAPRSPGDYGGPPQRLRELELIACGSSIVAGADEVGRGSLAGPVVAAAVILNPRDCPPGLDDSKKLTPDVRQKLFLDILASARSVSVYFVGPRRIDTVNILRASHEAVCRAVAALTPAPAIALVDGLPIPAFPCPHEAIIKGDGQECCIAAASIVAKVTRDRLMMAYAAHFPQYGFDRHKGYATPFHHAAIREYGLCALHRRSFTRSFAGECVQRELPL